MTLFIGPTPTLRTTNAGYGIQIGHDVVFACLSAGTRAALQDWATSTTCEMQVRACVHVYVYVYVYVRVWLREGANWGLSMIRSRVLTQSSLSPQPKPPNHTQAVVPSARGVPLRRHPLRHHPARRAHPVVSRALLMCMGCLRLMCMGCLRNNQH